MSTQRQMEAEEPEASRDLAQRRAERLFSLQATPSGAAR